MFSSARTALTAHGFPLVAGFALMLAWSYAPLLGGEPFYVGHHLGFSACALLLALVRPMRTAVDRRAWISWAAAALCAASGMCACLLHTSSALRAAVGCAGGVGSCILLARWFMAYCYDSVKISVVRVLFAFLGCALLRIGLLAARHLNPGACAVLLALLPCASLIILMHVELPTHKKSWASGTAGGTLQPSREIPRFFAAGDARFLVFEIAVFGLAMGITRTNFSHWSLTGSVGIVSQLLQVCIPLVLYWWFVVRTHQGSQEPLVRSLIVGAAIGMLGLFAFGGLIQYALSSLSLCASTLVLILMYIRMLDAVARSGTHPFVALGLVRGSLELAIVGGVGIFQIVSHLLDIELLPLDLATFAVGAMLILLVNSYSLRSTWEFLDEPRAQGSTDLDARCMQLTEIYKLNEAEAAVMRYLCLGRSKKYIAAELSMSEDSVRYHAKQLYRKLDIHSREELMTVAGVE